MKKIIVRILIILLSLHILFCVFFYVMQRRFIFYPTKLEASYNFSFGQKYEEVNIKTQDNCILNGLLFKVENPKGLIFYLHGNAGALDSWGRLAPVYTDLGYDVFFLDYRGFGKSEGEIDGQAQLLGDVQAAYNELKKHYEEDKIIVLGYSIGTGPAAYLASVNKPLMLILQAPYYSLTDVIQGYCPVVPEFLVKYKLETYKYIEKCTLPIVIFHGDEDKTIPYKNSVRLSDLLKDTDRFVTLSGEGHNHITYNNLYKETLTEILNKQQE
ncbi:pimeloyl-ACP methyl ester carboxylesterase [Dysgonomonas sp. PFB1-18]|uniref:alpha/beta hydrolase n=1 Tax=unclassified Dysgonomonas TaxID=2630389 RepID=UPI0024767163|nr:MULTISPECIES: alpha/beta fold hydrolase [unclassified Dysgonomonas]MDH6309227.1 pimeloyl-ACP methyl ester carboxylesterase [Dysgonomonas sp. PF1-14]MDH6338893.1 pimeloyl-ACP methyl ester carboxylesterase [Dysgonomonas sp. PF1-16]MDH6380476.1 pimeloyl-ACP methyl ester carboxylesterase [Dysgonomonas sp. PFB1-18]MDH6397721.1 pimeloyl-ACP methyl ester carboxylesterase [Dysgonomonas sp. PF1-23]